MSDQLEELRLQEHRPVTRALLKSLVHFVVYSALLYAIYRVFPPQDELHRKALGWGLYIASVLITSAFVLLLCWTAPTFKVYWLRNVRGYNLWCAYLPVPGGGFTYRVKLRGPVTLNDRELQQQPHELVIVLPLGGLFARSWVHVGEMACAEGSVGRVRKEMRKAQFRIVKIHEYTNAVIIQWRDHRGDRLTMAVSRALERLSECVHQSGRSIYLWDITNHERGSWETERERRYEAERVWIEAVNGLIAGARAIAATTRFGRSTEARCIRRQLANTALSVMSLGDPSRSEMEQLAKERVTVSVSV